MSKFLFEEKDLKPESDRFDALGSYIDHMLRDGIEARQKLEPRWEIQRDMYNNKEGCSGVKQIVKGVPVRHFPLVSPRVDRAANSVYQQVTAPKPWFSAVPDGREQERADDLEEGIQNVLEMVGFNRQLKLSLKETGKYGQSILWAPVDKNGIKAKVIDPKDFVAFPTFDRELRDADLAGHKYRCPVWKIKADQESKRFFEFTIGGDSQSEDDADNPSISDQEKVDLYDLIVRIPIKTKDGEEMRRYRVIYAESEQKICLIEPYELSRPWYFSVTFHPEVNQFWVEDSIAYRLQGLQHDYTTFGNAMLVASMMQAGAPVIINNGELKSKLQEYGFASIITTSADAKAEKLELGTKLDVLPAVMEKIEQLADAACGVNQLGIGQELEPNTTATQTTILAQSLQQSENSFAAEYAVGLEEMLAFIHELFISYNKTLRKAYPKLGRDFWASLMTPVTWTVTGKSSEASPQVAMEKAAMVLAQAEKPNSRLNYAEAEKLFVQTLRLPVDTEALFSIEEDDERGVGGDVLPPGMGGMGGVPPELGVGIVPGIAPGGPGGLSLEGGAVPIPGIDVPPVA